MPDHHIVASFDLDLHNLRRTLGEMGGTAETMLKDAMVALARRDVSSAEAVVAADRGLDRSQRETEERAVLLIVRRQPMAMDLREVISAIRIAGDLERIGDMAKNIAKRVLAIRDEPQPDGLAAGIRRLADMVLEQLRNVLDAYDRRDDEAALKVWQSDASIDALYTALFRETLAFMVEDPHRITLCTHLLFCAKNIERVGDHVTSIAETVHYLGTGESLTERPKQDNSYYATVTSDRPDRS
jgi:phosphate transport system protein